MEEFPPNTKKAVQLTCEKEASTWLTTMPIEEQSFFLYKGDFKVQWPSDMVGIHKDYPRAVYVARHSQ